MLTQQEIQSFLDDRINVPSHFAYASGITINRIAEDSAEGVLHIKENSLNPLGIVHGGALMTLADTVSGCLVWGYHGNCVTTNSSIEFLRAGTGDKIRCIATPVKMGRTLCVVRSDLYNNFDKLVATTTMTFYVSKD